MSKPISQLNVLRLMPGDDDSRSRRVLASLKIANKLRSGEKITLKSGAILVPNKKRTHFRANRRQS